MLKIAYLCRKSFFSDPGGDTVQLKKTLEELSLNKNFYGEVFTSSEKLIEKIDVFNGVHVFGVLDICEHIQVLNKIKEKGKKIFISTIYVDYYNFEKKSRSKLLRPIFYLLDKYQIEYVKNFIKFILKKRSASIKYFFYGHKKSVCLALSLADAVLPNSQSELARVEEDFIKVKNPFVVVNGIDSKIFRYRTSQSIQKSINFLNENFPGNKFADAILCVGRVEGRKAQLNIIKSLKNSNYNLYIIGKPASNQMAYYKSCIQEAGSNTFFLNFVSHEILVHIFTVAKVHVLPSWFETTGLVSLEAAACGCSIVVSSLGDTKDYFKDFAHYCYPDDILSIRNAIDKAYTESPLELSSYIANHYTWQLAAEQTLNCYNSLILNEVSR